MILLLFADEVIPTPPGFVPISTLVYIVAGILLVMGAGLIIFSKRKDLVHTTETKRADSNEKLIKTVETEKQYVERERDKAISERDRAREDIDSIKREYKSLVGIDINMLMKFWEQKQQIEAHTEKIEAENRRLKIRLEDYEK